MILIVSPRNDVHALCVAQDLEKMGKAFRFVDSSRLTSEGRLQFRAGQHSGSTWTCTTGGRLRWRKWTRSGIAAAFCLRLPLDFPSAINSISNANGRR